MTPGNDYLARVKGCTVDVRGATVCSSFSPYSTPVTCGSAPKPDLTASLDSFTNTIKVGDSITFRGSVKNDDVVDVPTSNGRFQVKSTSASTWTNVGGLVPTGPIAKNSGTGSTTAPVVTLSTWTAPYVGNFQVRFCADVDLPAPGKVDESNEYNNCSELGVITASFSPYTLACSPSQSSGNPGTSMTWTATPSTLGSFSFTWDSVSPECLGSTASTKNCTYTEAKTNYMNVIAWSFISGWSPITLCDPYIVTESSPQIAVDFKVVDSLDGDHKVKQGGSVDITWTTSGSPNSCTASATPSENDWEGSISTSGGTESNVGPLSATGWQTFNILCTKPGVPDVSKTVAIEVIAPNICGDGIVQVLEACDDGNSNNNDTCTNSCTTGPNTSGPCNDTTICEPLRGETPLNCSECRGIIIEQ